jgi:hypothetical protein
MLKPRELAEILLKMAEEDEDMLVRIEDKEGNVHEIGEVCFYDDGERYEIAISAKSSKVEIEEEMKLNEVPIQT